jgi:magnesium transporter
MSFEITEDFLSSVRAAIEQQQIDILKEQVAELPAQDISILLADLSTQESTYLLSILSIEQAALVITELESDDQIKLLKTFDSKKIASFVSCIDSDDAVDIINQLNIQQGEEVIGYIDDEEKANHIKDLLHYDEDCAGGLMAKELIKANLNWSVEKCIEEIRIQSKNVDKIYSIYVVDDNMRLLGRVGLKRMLLAEDNALISDIYEPKIISVESYRSGSEVAELMQHYDLETIPVVNVQGKLLGRITIDDVMDFITEQVDAERQMMAGITEDTDEDDSVWILAKSRLPWLIVGIFGGILGAQFIGVFEHIIHQVTAMAFFIPLITATGGNVGIQSSSMVVQSLARDSAYNGMEIKKFVKGFVVSLVNGVVISLLVFGFNFFINPDSTLAIVVSLSLLSVVLVSSFMGTITPLILNRLDINPALASGPFITTANDLLGIAIYFSVAHLLYQF